MGNLPQKHRAGHALVDRDNGLEHITRNGCSAMISMRKWRFAFSYGRFEETPGPYTIWTAGMVGVLISSAAVEQGGQNGVVHSLLVPKVVEDGTTVIVLEACTFVICQFSSSSAFLACLLLPSS